jgi:addiction module HigA family antidote
MPTKLKSQTITKPRTHSKPGASVGGVATSRLPRRRSPTHPGEMLLEEFIKPLGISQAELAVRLGISYPRLNEIVRGKRGITPNTALRLTRVVGMSPEFWLGLQLDFDLWQAMHSSEAQSIASLKPLRRPHTAKVG